MSAAAVFMLLAKISIILMVIAIGMNATPADATYLLRRPAQLVKALGSMNVVMPLFALLVCSIFNLNTPVMIALGVLSVSPVPPIFPNKSIKQGGKENYTIGILVASAVLSIVLIPLTLLFFQLAWNIRLNLAMGSVIKTVLMTVLVPLAVGMLLRAIAPSLSEKLAKPIGLIGTVLLAIAVIPILVVSTRSFLTIVGDGTLLALAALAMVGLISGHLLGGPKAENRTVLALATSARHPAIAITLAQASFPDEKLVAPRVLIYVVVSSLLAIPYLGWSRRSQTTAESKQEHVQA